MTDILIFLLITVFFVFKLKNVFGIRNDDDEIRKKAAEEFLKWKNQAANSTNNTSNNNNIIDITAEVSKPKEVDFDFNISSDTQKKLSKIGFEQENFLKGAEIDVEMVSEAFSRKDIKTLEKLLAKEVYERFKKQMDDLTSQGKNLKSSLVSVLSKKITNITSVEKSIVIDVLFDMEQINFIENDRGEVIFGTKRQIQNVKEQWTFERNINSSDNFWLVKNIVNIEK